MLEPFRLLLNSLHSIYEKSQAHEKASSTLEEILRVGVIQNFEVAYEFSWKFMKRWLEYNDSADAVNALSNESFHTYHISLAEEIYRVSRYLSNDIGFLEAFGAKND